MHRQSAEGHFEQALAISLTSKWIHKCECALNRDMDGSEDEDPSDDGESTDEDIRELRSKQEASAAPSDTGINDGGLQPDIDGDSLTPVSLHASSLHAQLCTAVILFSNHIPHQS